MDYEKRYKEALERARKLQENSRGMILKKWLWNIFPELRESEDERIRKSLLEHFGTYHSGSAITNDVVVEDVLTWLEKQGEQKVSYTTLVETGNGGINALVTKEITNGCDDEKKHSDKVEPKFHEGDWVILTAGELSTTLQIVDVDTNKKLYWFNDSTYLPIVDEECLHHWTIQDAKDGDVLVDVYGNIGIFEKYDDFDWTSYCFSWKSGSFHHFKADHENEKTYPATKEQRDTLFKAMADAGYTFDFESKELKLLITNGDDCEAKKNAQKSLGVRR